MNLIALSGMKKTSDFTILITGISGYWGQSLMHYLKEINFKGRVIGIDIKKPKAQYPFLDFKKMDIRDEGMIPQFNSFTRKTLHGQPGFSR